MSPKEAERFVWALEMLAIDPADRLLEIGCGHGVFVSLVCERLGSGRIVAIDRSPAMIEQAARRNREHVDAGKAEFEAVSLADADLGRRFDKAFVINVRLFREDATREADALRRLLTPDGALYFFQQHPSAGRTRAVTDELRTELERHGFTVRMVESTGAGDSTMTCIVARS